MSHENQNISGPEAADFPSVYDYLDYRKYLNDYYTAKKRDNPSFSYTVFANMAGCGSSSLFFYIAKGKRNITHKYMAGFMKALELTVREKRYFENLVNFNQAGNIELKKFYYEKILPIYKKEHGCRLKDNQYKYISNWYIPVIRELIMHDNFVADPKWIAKKLKNKITPAEAKNAVHLLMDLGMVVKNGDGRLKVTDQNIVSPDLVVDVGVFNYHNQMIDLAKASMNESVQDSWREIAGLTASLTDKQLVKLKQYLIDFRNKLMHDFQDVTGEPKEVYQLNFQFFSLTKSNGGKIYDK